MLPHDRFGSDSFCQWCVSCDIKKVHIAISMMSQGASLVVSNSLLDIICLLDQLQGCMPRNSIIVNKKYPEIATLRLAQFNFASRQSWLWLAYHFPCFAAITPAAQTDGDKTGTVAGDYSTPWNYVNIFMLVIFLSFSSSGFIDMYIVHFFGVGVIVWLHTWA